jgi:hypothetical protein
MTEAEETVEEREMLSVETFMRALKSDAARDFFFVGNVGDGEDSAPVAPSVTFGLDEDPEALED